MSIGFDPDWVEAAAFGWLAARTMDGLPGNLPAVTGANHPVILGGIYTA
jgi:anhydro-N-acetylmuramic acid kinase